MSWATPTDPQPDLVFLVGPAHSGKTEIGAALRHEGTLVVRRAYFWREEYGSCGPLDQDSNLTRLLGRLADDEFLRTAGVTIHDLARVAETTKPTYGGLFLRVTLEAVRNVSAHPEGPDRLVIQIGGLERLAGAVLADLPNSVFIHAIRDPRRYFGESPARLGRLGWRLASWSSSAMSALRNSVASPDRYLVVRAEDLVQSPEVITALISNRVGDRVVFNGVSDSLSAKGMPLSERKSQIVERLVGHQLVALGYELDRQVEQIARSSAAMDAGTYHLRTRLSFRSGAPT